MSSLAMRTGFAAGCLLTRVWFAHGLTSREIARTEQASTRDDAEFPYYRMLLDNFQNVQYSATLSVGGQTVHGVLDTGSFELLVFSKACRICGQEEQLYEHTGSPSWEGGSLQVKHSFGSGDTWSDEAFDDVSFGPLVAKHQPFWEVVDSDMQVLSMSSFQAIVGIGPPGSAVKLLQQELDSIEEERQSYINEGQAVPQEVLDDLDDAEKAIERARTSTTLFSNLGVRSFSVCIGQQSGEPGHFVWNDKDPRLSPQVFKELPMAGDIHWSLEMSDVRLGEDLNDPDGIEVGCYGESCGAVLDSGTSLLAAPKDAIAKVGQALQRLNGDCTRLHELPDLRFKLGNHEFSLPPESYVGQVTGEIPQALMEVLEFEALRGQSDGELVQCQPLFMNIDADTQFGSMWILGLPFFRKYYTTFETKDCADGNSGCNSVFVAHADPNCSPAMEDASSEAAFLLMGRPKRHNRILQVNATHLQVPRWARKAIRAKKSAKKYRV